MNKPWHIVESADPQVAELIGQELQRQSDGLELIASENFASPAVIACMGNIMTNKYAEGLPGRRYYGGCEVIDRLETLAIERACQLFGASYANVQPHSGAQANAAVLLALLETGDPILGMDLSHGGHLTHGSKVNFSGRLYDSHFYTVDEKSGRLDMDAVRQKALSVRPKMIIAGASAYARSIDFAAFRSIADETGAWLLVDMAHIAGLVAAGLHPSPVPHAHVITSTTHKTLKGPRGGLILWNDEELSARLNKGVFPGTQGGPLEHIICAKALCFREASQPEFRSYQQQVLANSRKLSEELQIRGFRLVSGGSDNHLLLLDLSGTDVSGKVFEEALGKAHITVNKNTVPGEKRSPFVTSGIRIGTPALTSRGFREEQMKRIADLMKQVFDQIGDDAALNVTGEAVRNLAAEFPLYPDWRTS
ncbi:MAG: serine hydroxymethyltransferase [Deltaproteobacteria bacterium]|nr:serine hydroxymethyltransferase [Deltaproteobacteria bacterium]